MTDSALIGWLIGLAVVPPLIISLISLYPVRRFASQLGLIANPGGHSTHTNVTPLGGGIGIWLGIILPMIGGTLIVCGIDLGFHQSLGLPDSVTVFFSGIRSRLGQLWCLLGAGTVLFALGIWDDRRGAPVGLRLLIEFGVAAFVVYVMGFGLTAFIGAPALTNLLSVIWIVAVINSFNMLDNMDGLSGGVAAIIAASMAAVMLTTPGSGGSLPQLFVAGLLLCVCGSLLGFLWHNRPPAKLFMGDGGSYLVGFLIAVSMLMATFASEPRPHAVLAPICAMLIPMYDMGTVLWIRIREGRSVFKGDRSHFSHRLVALGLSRTQAVLTIHLVTATCGLASLLLVHVTVLQAIAVLGIVGCMLLLVVILESTGWRKQCGE
ncbi:MraY family glycosyltransferase [Roseiconus lacunae]|uniref:MraY family glycosyltransferase n=1 Tax=Roseiconus lacunae TaxID=2605694 RepID=UPI001E5762ED|nr:MraY family glycosyltransferase [Roseiconus lacunae]MCD0463595.1 undecaprenyl/decaprenyl-phosphate alpha-N-acetylglucosaminyl 1-phosphate transferase [Roseiconus lacunae]